MTRLPPLWGAARFCYSASPSGFPRETGCEEKDATLNYLLDEYAFNAYCVLASLVRPTTRRLAVKQRILQIRESLAAAFGGYSQYDFQILGQALAGQICNNALGRDGSETALCAEAARQECERWEDEDWDEVEIADSIEVACRAALEHLGVWHDKMPVPIETPRRERGERGERHPRAARVS